jgi:hypothetical protein
MSRFALMSVAAVSMLWAFTGPANAQDANTQEFLPEAQESPQAGTAASAASNAAAVYLHFVFNGQVSNPGSELLVSGRAPPNYAKKVVRATYARTTNLIGGIVWKRSATSVESLVNGKVAATGTSSLAEASVGSFSGKLSSVFGTFITVTTGPISTQTTFNRTKAGVVTAKGEVSMTRFRISAPSLGINKTFTGKPPANYVLYRSGDNSIIVWLNHQIVTKVNGKPTSITVRAVDARISNLKLVGNTISGSIIVQPTYAR